MPLSDIPKIYSETYDLRPPTGPQKVVLYDKWFVSHWRLVSYHSGLTLEVGLLSQWSLIGG